MIVRTVVWILPLSPKSMRRLVSIAPVGVSCLIVSTSRVPWMSPRRARAARRSHLFLFSRWILKSCTLPSLRLFSNAVRFGSPTALYSWTRPSLTSKRREFDG